MVSLAGAIVLGFQRYFDFSGRSSRSEYWWWFLFSTIAGFIPFVGLVLLIPNIAIGVRRLHDINRTGWWILFAFLFFWLVGEALGQLFIARAGFVQDCICVFAR